MFLMLDADGHFHSLHNFKCFNIGSFYVIVYICSFNYVSLHHIGYLQASQSIIWAIQSRRTRLTAHVASIGIMRNAHNILGKEQPEVIGVDERIILEWILGK